MYERLAEALRNMDVSDACPCNVGSMCDDQDCIVYQAADAIEELEKAVPRWIPVTERLPKLNSDMYSDDLIVCMRRFDGESYYYEKFAGYLTSGNTWYTYQHDSCSQVGIEQHMKHYRSTADVIVAWMPMPSLPELPKEGE